MPHISDICTAFIYTSKCDRTKCNRQHIRDLEDIREYLGDQSVKRKRCTNPSCIRQMCLFRHKYDHVLFSSNSSPERLEAAQKNAKMEYLERKQQRAQQERPAPPLHLEDHFPALNTRAPKAIPVRPLKPTVSFLKAVKPVEDVEDVQPVEVVEVPVETFDPFQNVGEKMSWADMTEDEEKIPEQQQIDPDCVPISKIHAMFANVALWDQHYSREEDPTELEQLANQIIHLCAKTVFEG